MHVIELCGVTWSVLEGTNYPLSKVLLGRRGLYTFPNLKYFIFYKNKLMQIILCND